MARHWTPEERAKQAAAIKKWQPWKHSTGAKTTAGKQRSAQNATKHGRYGVANQTELRLIRAYLREQRRFLNSLKTVITETTPSAETAFSQRRGLLSVIQNAKKSGSRMTNLALRNALRFVLGIISVMTGRVITLSYRTLYICHAGIRFSRIPSEFVKKTEISGIQF